MKIISYNLRAGGPKQGNQWQCMADDFAPDLYFVQETRAPSGYFADDAAAMRGCVHSLAPHGKWGSAIVARHHALEAVPLPGFDGWVAGARIRKATIGGVARSLLMFSIHAPSPAPYERSVNLILDAIHRVWDRKSLLILAGDFNLTTAIRHAKESRKNSRGERNLLVRLRREFGLLNAWQVLKPNEDLPQTLRWARDPLPPYHCDAIFVSHALLPHLADAHIESGGVWGQMSDHSPVLVTLD